MLFYTHKRTSMKWLIYTIWLCYTFCFTLSIRSVKFMHQPIFIFQLNAGADPGFP